LSRCTDGDIIVTVQENGDEKYGLCRLETNRLEISRKKGTVAWWEYGDIL